MGHTVVLGFDKDSTFLIHKLLAPFEVNKIPYGRRCDRAVANDAMDYHMTLCHWPKTMDTDYLPRLNGFQSAPCKIQVTGLRMMQAEDSSWVLYFEVSPTDSLTQLTSRFEKHTEFCVSDFYHITLAVGKEHNEIAQIRDYIYKNQVFPFALSADRIDLYKIWSPTQKIMSL